MTIKSRARLSGILAAGIVALFTVSAASAQTPPADLFSNAAVVRAKTGQVFEISLPDQSGSTGYVWTIPFMHSKGLEKVTFLGQIHRHPQNPDGRVGGIGSVNYKFLAILPGEAHILFESMRPWAPAPGKSIAYRIDIEP